MKTVSISIADTKGTFEELTSAVVILRLKRGVQKQAKLYTRGKQIFVGHGGGFIPLKTNNTTSLSDVYWEEIIPTSNEPFTYRAPRVGYLEVV